MNNYTNNTNTNLQRNITSIIEEKLEKVDKNLNDCLILKLENGETIFVFHSNINKYRWEDLNINQKFKFIVEEGKNGANILLDFEITAYE